MSEQVEGGRVSDGRLVWVVLLEPEMGCWGAELEVWVVAGLWASSCKPSGECEARGPLKCAWFQRSLCGRRRSWGRREAGGVQGGTRATRRELEV